MLARIISQTNSSLAVGVDLFHEPDMGDWSFTAHLNGLIPRILIESYRMKVQVYFTTKNYTNDCVVDWDMKMEEKRNRRTKNEVLISKRLRSYSSFPCHRH